MPLIRWEKRDGLIAMHQIQGIGWHTLCHLLDAGWDPSTPWTETVAKNARERGVRSGVLTRIASKWTAEWVNQVRLEMEKRRIHTVTRWDTEYPSLLKELPQPPWVLYVKGDASLLAQPGLAIVGTRKPTVYGKDAAATLAEKVAAAGWVVISGMAAGVDGLAHSAALGASGKTVAVLGSGVDVVYPKHHRDLYARIVQAGAVVSEVPPGTRPHPGLFPQRNRIISGLSWGTIVVEAAEKSGSLITADCSMEQGREVFAVPGPIHSTQSQGALRLIQQGAKCVVTVQDIFEEFDHRLDAPVPSDHSEDTMEEKLELTEEEAVLLAYLERGPLSLEELAASVERPLDFLHQDLIQLQLKGIVKQLPGARFQRRRG
ncbi:DNA-processing protein DprA [Desmospora activa]|uniref:DNA processing protein n=1 Tax=Desmospora activa DSM 45169 TaxID=1121389 RepID=A0A2T4ZAR4_9BACL|nr:DNA-processing protein DprA [Desmospora activa]PTM58982.1 DNA processing protein [Desmospora activa DSM 45169]